ncbi:hypothetical protein P3102_37300 [Amycolatopsis sp. QT-25]|uniref:hypothetical protein n=1 Tax=Amycolatopsis sp. QT-25 TaxID=3034022 RepID=UPI0023EABE5D|nr:hypothetical protein [Amycolatopsis sp. QT-25]WET79601.1 hypothetical protein P3102_37300 [Amycolatopsis sp. QT-25]
MRRSGRTNGPSPATSATGQARRSSIVDTRRTSGHQVPPSHKMIRPVSSPDVAKSRNGGNAHITSAPPGAKPWTASG